MTLDLTPDELLTTTRAVRKRLDLDRPVERTVIDGIPYERCTQAGLLPVAYTKGTDFEPASRLPLERVSHWNHW
jgi:hypothetical protein